MRLRSFSFLTTAILWLFAGCIDSPTASPDASVPPGSDMQVDGAGDMGSVVDMNRPEDLQVSMDKGVSGGEMGMKERACFGEIQEDTCVSWLTAPSQVRTFGTSMDIDENTLVVGVPGASLMAGEVYDVTVTKTQGVVFVYERSSATAPWKMVKRMELPGAGQTNFGHAVALKGDTIVVGAPTFSIPPNAIAAGVIFLARKRGAEWALDSMNPKHMTLFLPPNTDNSYGYGGKRGRSLWLLCGCEREHASRGRAAC